MISLALVLIFLALVNAGPKPIIGILTLGPTNSECVSYKGKQAASGEGGCFSAFYVKWIEQGGGRVVPIRYTSRSEDLDNLLKSINGVLFTGGELTLTPNSTYYASANYIYNRVLEFNTQGDYFPLWGTCQGFQLLNILTSKNVSVLSVDEFDSDDLSLPLELTVAAKASRMLGSAPADVFTILQTENVTSNLHVSGVKPEDFTANTALVNFYNVLSNNHDRANLAFVSTMEAKDFPIYATQWHPERPQFDWEDDENIDHSLDAVRAMQYVANFFVNETRKNMHSFPTPDAEDAALIYNYNPTYLGDSYQVYTFK
jgi:gamma-glutamyl hydrolase